MKSFSVKSIFLSKTFWGVVLATVSSLALSVNRDIQDGNLTSEEISGYVGVLFGAGMALVGRVTAEGPVYTPKGIPGPDKEDLI